MVDQNTNRTQYRLYTIGVIVILLLSGAVVMLMLKNYDLRARLRGSPTVNILDELKPGDRVDAIEAQSIDGRNTTITYAESGMKYLVLVFSTTCPYCVENIEKWRAIARYCQQEGCSVIGVSVHDIDRTRQYLLDMELPFFTVINTGREFADAYKITGVPMTILISTGGIIEKTWPGVLSDAHVEDIFDGMKPPLHRSTN